MEWLINRSFYQKLQLSLITFIVVPFIIASVISFLFIENEVSDRVRNSNQQILRVISLQLAETIEDITFTSNLFTNHVSFQGFMKELKQTEKIVTFKEFAAYQEVQDYFNLVESKTMNGKIKMFIVNPQDFIVINTNNYDLNQAQEDWKQLSLLINENNTQKVQWLGLLDRNQQQGDYFTAKIIKDRKTNDDLGAVVISITEEYFNLVFGSSNEGAFRLTDHEGNLVFANEVDVQEKEQITSQLKVERLGWNLSYIMPQSSVTGNINQIFYWFVVVVSGFALLFLLISVFLAKTLSRPINQFIPLVNSIGNGDLNVRFPVKGKNEMSLLGKTFNQMVHRIKTLILEIEQEQEEKREIELQALFAQIQPHFLINTLNSLKVNLALAGDQINTRRMNALIQLLRAYMKVYEPATLQQESLIIIAYLEIMKMRNDKEIHYIEEIAEEDKEFKVPRLILQPLIENAVLHGFSEKIDDPKIKVVVQKIAHELLIKVEDNGKGMSDEECKAIHDILNSLSYEGREISTSGIGLLNVQKRMILAFGKKARMEISSELNKGTTVKIFIPYE